MEVYFPSQGCLFHQLNRFTNNLYVYKNKIKLKNIDFLDSSNHHYQSFFYSSNK